MSGIRPWFEGRSLRERRMILVMLGLLALTILWGGIIRPVRDGLSSARERHADAVVRLAATQSELAAIKGAGRLVPLTGSLADAVRLRADAAGFRSPRSTSRGQGGSTSSSSRRARRRSADGWRNWSEAAC